MPYTAKAHRYFEAVAHGDATKKGGPSKEEAAKLASEGVKPSEKKKRKSKRPTVTTYRG